MKTSEFYCPLHNSTAPIVTLISCHVDNWDNYICYECSEIKKDFCKVDIWIADSNSKLDSGVKKKIKSNQLIYFECNNFDDDLLHQSINKISYFDKEILYQRLYQCGMLTVRRRRLDWRLSYQSMRSCYTLDLDYYDDEIPYLFLDDEALIKANYKRKHSDG